MPTPTPGRPTGAHRPPRRTAAKPRAVPHRGARPRTGGPVPPPPPPAPAPGGAPPGSFTGRAAVLLLVLAVLAVSYAYPLRTWFEQRAQLADLRATQARLTSEIADVERQTARWDDPAYVAAQARDRLSYVRPGEVGLRVIGASPEEDEARSRAQVQRAPAGAGPWWSRTWASVEAADRPEAAGP